MTPDSSAAPVHLFEYEAWHFADQKVNAQHDQTIEPLTCEDCPSVNPWRDGSDG